MIIPPPIQWTYYSNSVCIQPSFWRGLFLTSAVRAAELTWSSCRWTWHMVPYHMSIVLLSLVWLRSLQRVVLKANKLWPWLALARVINGGASSGVTGDSWLTVISGWNSLRRLWPPATEWCVLPCPFPRFPLIRKIIYVIVWFRASWCVFDRFRSYVCTPSTV